MYNPIRQPLMAFWAFALLAISMLWGASAYAITPAGTVIKNLAIVTYEDSLGNSYTAQSNESTVKVAEVFDAVLERTQEKDGTPGQIVYFQHQLVNNGNTEDSFTLAVASSDNLTELKVFQDINGNGQPDSGESEIIQTGAAASATDVDVAAGTATNLVVQARVPDNPIKDTLTLTLTATSTNLSFQVGTEGSDENTDTINVITDAPVLVTKKQVIKHTPAKLNTPGTVKYLVEVTNNGKDLAKGAIYDFFPTYMDVDNLTVDKKGSLLLGDREIKESLKNELPTGEDGPNYIPGNTHSKGLYIPIEKPLVSGASLAFEITIDYTAKNADAYAFEAGDKLENKVFVGFNSPSNTADTAPWTDVSESNITTVTLPHFYGVDAGDPQTEEQAAAGGIASFINTITNYGNGHDTFNLAATNLPDAGGFPAGTTFTFWDETGKIPMVDTNGDGTVDTGVVLGEGGSINIMMKAHIPADASEKTTPSSVTLTATSVGDSNITDLVTNTLNSITTEGNGVDLAHYKVNQDNEVTATDPSSITIPELLEADNKHSGAEAISTVTLKSGKTARFGLFIANESTNSSSFSITTSIDSNPGWKVTYYHDGIVNAEGTDIPSPTGQIITSTPTLAGRTVMKVIAEIEVPADASAADYNVSFTTGSSTYDLTDTTNNKIVVQSHSALEFGPGGANQMEAGGIAFYEHQLKNVGNTPLTVTITGPGVDTLNGWNYLILNEDGNQIETPITLAAGSEAKNITVKVLAPANAPAGYVFNLPLTATASDGVTSATLTNTATIIKGQVVLRKTVAKVNADGSYDETFATHLPDAIKPGEKVVWKVQAVVQGSAQAKNVIISDAAPPFTSLAVGTGNPKIGPVEAPSNQFHVNGSNITFYVGEGANKTNPDGEKGGILNPGQSVEVTFEVVIDE